MRFVATVNGQLPAADWNNMFGDPPTQDVATSQSTTSTSYTDLATSGPSRSYTLNAGQVALVVVSCVQVHPAGAQAWMSFTVTGASPTLAPSDVNAATSNLTTNAAATVSRMTVFIATTTGTHTFTTKYRTEGVSVFFADRRLIVIPR